MGQVLGTSPSLEQSPSGKKSGVAVGLGWCSLFAPVKLQDLVYLCWPRIAFSKPYVEIPATYLVPGGSQLSLGLTCC